MNHHHSRELAVDGTYVDLDGEPFYRLTGYDHLPPFLFTLVSSGDVWFFMSTSGGLTAGRGNADHALFPYYTEDKLTDTATATGGITIARVLRPDGTRVRWEPLSPTHRTDPAASRALYKNVLGTSVVFEETRADLGVRLRVRWSTSSRFGVVRQTRLAAIGSRSIRMTLLDGLHNLLPPTVDALAQNTYSNLIDAYKRAELDPATGQATYWMGSQLTDRAEPSEALLGTVCWRLGLPDATVLLDDAQLDALRRGTPPQALRETRGRRGAYLLHTKLTLEPGEEHTWRIVADLDANAADVVALRAALRTPETLRHELDADLARGGEELRALLARADALQLGGEETTYRHHLANVLFNAMRGGAFASGYVVGADDVRSFVTQRSPRTALRRAAELDALPPSLPAVELQRLADASPDPDLKRLLGEYLPLSFGRRHGDPSRPWNKFSIAPTDANGQPHLNYQGNWRDIFQNWEALAWSFPEYTESMITVFLSATTADGYNPYRVSRAGIDWETPDPADPWAHIGYWSDHQIVYLQALLEVSQRVHPGRISTLLQQKIFTYGDVPYRIRPFQQILLDPRNTIDYDTDHAAVIRKREIDEGADGRLLHHDDGDLVRVTGVEKLLLLLLAKLVNLVPGAGIWMNTQRPEWNDANNALVGYGLSVVTLAQLHRYLTRLPEILGDPAEGFTLTEELATLLVTVHNVLTTITDPDSASSDDERRTVMTLLGEAGCHYRSQVYAGLSGRHVQVSGEQVRSLLTLALRVVRAGLHANQRDDGLYHAYNLLRLLEGTAAVDRLPLMLEGQVAVLSSGLLQPEETAALLARLRQSDLYEPNRQTYLLYPDRVLPGFVERNRFTAARAASCPLVEELVSRGDHSVVVRDNLGDFHFAGGMRNADAVREALTELAEVPELAPLIQRDADLLLQLYEEVFQHRRFTGRSGSFFGYEGLGSVYWHMVAKLQLAALEAHTTAVEIGTDPTVIRTIAEAYQEIRSGLGFKTSPAAFGAFPTDPYSHTPAAGGARQPGMTGQVKEAVLARFGELGLHVRDGRIVIRPPLLDPAEWTSVTSTFLYLDLDGQSRKLSVPAGCLAFTYCQVPVLYRRQRAPRLLDPTHRTPITVTVRLADGQEVTCSDGMIDAEVSRSVFRREGLVRSIDVTVPDPSTME